MDCFRVGDACPVLTVDQRVQRHTSSTVRCMLYYNREIYEYNMHFIVFKGRGTGTCASHHLVRLE